MRRMFTAFKRIFIGAERPLQAVAAALGIVLAIGTRAGALVRKRNGNRPDKPTTTTTRSAGGPTTTSTTLVSTTTTVDSPTTTTTTRYRPPTTTTSPPTTTQARGPQTVLESLGCETPSPGVWVFGNALLSKPYPTNLNLDEATVDQQQAFSSYSKLDGLTMWFEIPLADGTRFSRSNPTLYYSVGALGAVSFKARFTIHSTRNGANVAPGTGQYWERTLQWNGGGVQSVALAGQVTFDPHAWLRVQVLPVDLAGTLPNAGLKTNSPAEPPCLLGRIG